MDDKQLTDLFRAAADDAGAVAPPPTFDHDDVLAGSHRMARRQRATVAVAVVAMAMISVGAVFSSVLRGPSQTSALAERPPAASAAQPENATGAGNAAGTAAVPAPGIAPMLAPQIAPAPYAADSAGPSARSKVLAAPGGGCAEADARVFTQLTAALPAAGNATPHAVTGGCGPGGAGVAVDVNDAGATGTLEAVLTPPTVDPAIPADSTTQASATARTPSGGVVRLTAIGARPGAVPYRARLAQLATALAALL